MRPAAPGRAPSDRPPHFGRTRGRAPSEDARPGGSEEGSAVVEFSLVAVLLLTVLLGIVQVAVYLHVRNVAAASAAEGARYAANADVEATEGAERAGDVLRRGAGDGTADRLTCAGSEDVGPGGVTVVTVRCGGALPVFFAPLGAVLPVRVSARSVEEGQ